MICPTCGERIADDLDECPYCETPVEPEPPARSGIAVVNVKEGRPIVELARDRLDAAIKNHQSLGTAGLVLIHGYGSTGAGGRIRAMVHGRLRHLKAEGVIQDYIPGEDIGRTRSDRFPTSYHPAKADVGNPGITIVRF